MGRVTTPDVYSIRIRFDRVTKIVATTEKIRKPAPAPPRFRRYSPPLFCSASSGRACRGWLFKGAALFVITLGISTVWQGLRFFLVMLKLVV